MIILKWNRLCIGALLVSILGISPVGSMAAEGVKLAEARDMVERGMSPPEFTIVGSPIDVGVRLKGKRVLWLQGFSGAYWDYQNVGFLAAMEAAGIEVTSVDPAGDMIRAAREIENAINRGYDLIQLGNETPQELAAPIKAAKAAGIPVNCLLSREPGPLSEEEKSIGCVAATTIDYKGIGELAAAASFVMSDGDETLQAIAYNSPGGSGVADIETNGYLDKLKYLCDTCKVSQVDAPVATWSTDLGPLTTSQIVAHPDLDWLFPIYGVAVQYMVPSIAAAGAEGKVRIGTQYTSTTTIQQIKQGDLAYAVSIPLEWFGLAVADAAFRILLGQQVPDDIKLPFRLFTAENVVNIDAESEPPNQVEWFGVDYRTPYFKNWNLTPPEGYIR